MQHFTDIAPDNASRRAFLKRGTALSLAASAAPWAMTLAAMAVSYTHLTLPTIYSV